MKPAESNATTFSPAKVHEREEENVKLAVLKRTYDLLTSALSFVAALAWNDAIQTLFLRIFGESSTLIAKFLYAIVLTVIIVWFGSRLARLTRAVEERHEAKNNSGSKKS